MLHYHCHFGYAIAIYAAYNMFVVIVVIHSVCVSGTSLFYCFLGVNYFMNKRIDNKCEKITGQILSSF